MNNPNEWDMLMVSSATFFFIQNVSNFVLIFLIQFVNGDCVFVCVSVNVC